MLKKFKMLCPLQIVSQSHYSIQVVDTNSHTEWQTKKDPDVGFWTDLDLHCLQRQGISGTMFVCHYWQWPILISCVMCYYLCVLRWLMRPILALNWLLQIEQERSEEESFVGDVCSGYPLCSFLLGFSDSFCLEFISSPSYEALPLSSILCNLFPRLCWFVEVFKGGFEGVLVSLLLTTMGVFSNL